MSQKLSHVPRPSRCILRSCVVRPHSQWHWPPHVTHHHGHGTSGPSTAGTRIPCRPAGSARQRFAHIHMDSASLVLCRPAAAPVLASLCCRTRACPGPAPILQSPIRRSSHAAARPAAVAGRWLAGRFRQLRVFIFLLCTNRCNNNEFSVNLKIDSILFVSADPQFLGAINIFGWSPARSRCLASIRST